MCRPDRSAKRVRRPKFASVPSLCTSNRPSAVEPRQSAEGPEHRAMGMALVVDLIPFVHPVGDLTLTQNFF
jgi:hypothetical protein